MKAIFKIFTICLILSTVSCGKLEFPLENQVDAADVFKTKDDFINMSNSCYDIFMNQVAGQAKNLNELLSDNVYAENKGISSEYFAVYERGTIQFRTGSIFDIYNCIYRCNTVIEKLKSEDVGFTEVEKSSLESEMKFLRAYAHWELVKLYAKPYGSTSDNSHPGIPLNIQNSKTPQARSTVKAVYESILADLKSAESNLPSANGYRASKWAAKGLLAKVYFLMNDYQTSATYCKDIIDNSGIILSDSLNRFKDGAESEFLFYAFTNAGNQKSGGLKDNYRSDNTPNPAIKVSKDLFKLASHDSDMRRAFYEAKKPNTPSEYFITKKFNRDFFDVPLISLSEIVLTYSECLAEQGKRTEAYTELMKIRNRAYTGNYGSFDINAPGIALIDSIRKERRLELAFEGDRTPDAKRRGTKGEAVKMRNAPWNCPGMTLQFSTNFNTSVFQFNEEGGCN